MKREDCKEGVKVYWSGDKHFAADTGVVVSVMEGVFLEEEDYYDNVWVKWDSDHSILHINYKYLTLLDQSSEFTEEQAVMFLLSKGYTVSKGK